MDTQTSLEIDAGGPAASLTYFGGRLEPVEILVERECKFVAKPCGICGKPKSNAVHHKSKGTCPFRRQNGCVTCGGAKYAPEHFGAPESFNVFASGSWVAYQSAKQRLHAVLAPALEASELPKGLAGVMAEGHAIFDRAARRDQGNYRVVLEKALGDVLVECGYLEGDTWDRYEFGGLTFEVVPGRSATRLMLFPRA